jgi:hypothetical protein
MYERRHLPGSPNLFKCSINFSPKVLLNHEERRTNKCDNPLSSGNDSFVCSLKFSNIGRMQDWISSFDNLCPFDDEDSSSFSLPRISALCNADALDATHSAGSEMSDRNSKLTTCEHDGECECMG